MLSRTQYILGCPDCKGRCSLGSDDGDISISTALPDLTVNGQPFTGTPAQNAVITSQLQQAGVLASPPVPCSAAWFAALDPNGAEYKLLGGLAGVQNLCNQRTAGVDITEGLSALSTEGPASGGGSQLLKGIEELPSSAAAIFSAMVSEAEEDLGKLVPKLPSLSTLEEIGLVLAGIVVLVLVLK